MYVHDSAAGFNATAERRVRGRGAGMAVPGGVVAAGSRLPSLPIAAGPRATGDGRCVAGGGEAVATASPPLHRPSPKTSPAPAPAPSPPATALVLGCGDGNPFTFPPPFPPPGMEAASWKLGSGAKAGMGGGGD